MNTSNGQFRGRSDASPANIDDPQTRYALNAIMENIRYLLDRDDQLRKAGIDNVLGNAALAFHSPVKLIEGKNVNIKQLEPQTFQIGSKDWSDGDGGGDGDGDIVPNGVNVHVVIGASFRSDSGGIYATLNFQPVEVLSYGTPYDGPEMQVVAFEPCT